MVFFYVMAEYQCRRVVFLDVVRWKRNGVYSNHHSEISGITGTLLLLLVEIVHLCNNTITL